MDVLAAIDLYCDAVPRSAATVETIGSFTLFVAQVSAWPYYARPTLGATAFFPQDLLRVRERQRSLNAPQALEWVAEVAPKVRKAAELAGLEVHEHPLLVLDPDERHHLLPPQDVMLPAEARRRSPASRRPWQVSRLPRPERLWEARQPRTLRKPPRNAPRRPSSSSENDYAPDWL